MGMVFCRGCGKEIHESAVSCPHCGCQQLTATAANLKNQNVATVLAAFTGGFGIHRFYLSRPISGVLYLLFFWTAIPGLIAFVETLIYAFTSPQSWAQKYNNGQIGAPVHIALKILVVIFPAIFTIGILAAIAIPAYQDYVTRAREANLSTMHYEVDTHKPNVIELKI
ncbi:TM2 domain-containing protein [Massilia sp. IC2-476]|uniref:TM2 domain-containing protein n=1 Tax=Massilia sp. IC2-476 TaxID=2887199 RepID=UPI001D111C3F|nr:TM2 domain-containing protein [Massilia sp. IC2-476]MCC2971805.1 NINE protein [Massilia sp. IC2-476]